MIQAREADRYPEKNGWLVGWFVGWLKFTGVFNTTQVVSCLQSYTLSQKFISFDKTWNVLQAQCVGLKSSSTLRLPRSLIKYWLHKKSTYVRTLLTNHQQLLQIPYTNIESGQCSFSYCSPMIWNEIPATIQVSATAATFKHQLKSHFLSQLTTH